MQVLLSPEMQRFVEEKVRSGQFTSPEDVVNGALLVLRAQDVHSEDDLDELRRLVAVGVEQLDRGERRPWNLDDTKRRVAERARREKQAG